MLSFCDKAVQGAGDQGGDASGGTLGSSSGGQTASADGGDGAGFSDDADDLSNVEPSSPCDGFEGADPPCDPERDLISTCNVGSWISFEYVSQAAFAPDAAFELILLPLDGGQSGSGGSGTGYQVYVSSIPPPSTFTFAIDPVQANEFLASLGGYYDRRVGTLALVQGGRILEERRVFLVAKMNCVLP